MFLKRERPKKKLNHHLPPSRRCCLRVFLSQKTMLSQSPLTGADPQMQNELLLPNHFQNTLGTGLARTKRVPMGHTAHPPPETQGSTQFHSPASMLSAGAAPQEPNPVAGLTPCHCSPLMGARNQNTEHHRVRIYLFILQKWRTCPHESLHRPTTAVSRKYTDDWVFIIQTLLVVPKALSKEE